MHARERWSKQRSYEKNEREGERREICKVIRSSLQGSCEGVGEKAEARKREQTMSSKNSGLKALGPLVPP